MPRPRPRVTWGSIQLPQKGLELELELDASADPSHPTDDNGEESYSLISPIVP